MNDDMIQRSHRREPIGTVGRHSDRRREWCETRLQRGSTTSMAAASGEGKSRVLRDANV